MTHLSRQILLVEVDVGAREQDGEDVHIAQDRGLHQGRGPVEAGREVDVGPLPELLDHAGHVPLLHRLSQVTLHRNKHFRDTGDRMWCGGDFFTVTDCHFQSHATPGPGQTPGCEASPELSTGRRRKPGVTPGET